MQWYQDDFVSVSLLKDQEYKQSHLSMMFAFSLFILLLCELQDLQRLSVYFPASFDYI